MEAPFVGRDLAQAELSALLDAVCSGGGSLVLVAGEAGIGKTALVERAAEAARRRGVGVLWGSCWEIDGQSPYWPFVQVLRHYVAEHGWDQVVAAVGDDAPVLANLLPEVSGSSSAPEAPDGARFRLFDTLNRLLADEAGRRPLLVVLDDLHWADEGTLRYLGFLGHQLRGTRILVVGTYRDVDADPEAPLMAQLPTLTRLGPRIDLGGLSRSEVGELLHAATGSVPEPGLVAEVHRLSGGNPLFASEIARLQLSGRPQASVPAGVRHVATQRFALLPDDVVELLRQAAVLGTSFDVQELVEMSGRPAPAAHQALTEAMRARVLSQSTDPRRVEFLHALLRDALYEQLTATELMDLHQRAAEAIESSDESAGRIAHHLALGPDPASAVDPAMTAGRHALRLLAYEDAAHHFRRADSLLAAAGGDPGRRGRVLLQLGNAYRRAGDERQTVATYDEALQLGQRSGDPELVADATIGWCRPQSRLDEHQPQLVRRLQDALDGLPATDSALRPRVMARLAMEMFKDRGSIGRAHRLSDDAVAMARRVGDLLTLAITLMARISLLRDARTAPERLAAADELYDVGYRLRDEEMMVEGQQWRTTTLLELGDRVAASEALDIFGPIAERLRSPVPVWQAKSCAAVMACMDGRFDTTAELVDAADAAAARLTYLAPAPARIHQQRLASLALLRGDLDAATAAVEQVADLMTHWAKPPAHAVCTLTRQRAEVGQTDQARILLDALLADGTAQIGSQAAGSLALVELAETAFLLGAGEYAESLFEALKPYAGLVAVERFSARCVAPVDEALGLLASMRDRRDEAVEHLDAALRLSTRMSARMWMVRNRVRLARALLDRDAPGDRDQAGDLATRAREQAAEIGMVPFERQAAELLTSAAPAVDRATAEVRFEREGDYWTLRRGTAPPHRLRHSKGLQYLAELVSHPDKERHALDLAGARTGGPGPVSPDLGPQLDATAKAAYRRRLEDLREEQAEAETFNDPERAARAQEEIDALAGELARAVGLGGRDRPVGSAAERARLNVTRGLRSAIARIEAVDPELGHHLDTTVRTGQFCKYEPGPNPPFTWSG